MNEDRIRARIKELESKVSRKMYGDGVMQFQGVEDWRDYPSGSAESKILYELAMAYGELEANEEFDEVLEDVETAADEVLKGYGFTNGVPYEVYWSEKNKKWKRVHPALIKKIHEEEGRFWDQVRKGEKPGEWLYDPRKPWRRSMSFPRWLRENVNRFSELETAIDMKREAPEAFQTMYLVEDQIAEENFEDVPETLNRLALESFRLGRLYERLYWKQNHEGAALKAIEYSQRQTERSEKGGQKSSENAEIRKHHLFKIAVDNLAAWVGEDGKGRTKAVHPCASERP